MGGQKNVLNTDLIMSGFPLQLLNIAQSLLLQNHLLFKLCSIETPFSTCRSSQFLTFLSYQKEA